MSSASRRSRSHSTLASPTNPSSKRSFSLATSPRSMVYRGKRARRDSSPSSKPQAINIPVASSSFVLMSGSSTASPLAAIPTNLASSAPPTPLFPSTSAAFFTSSHSSNLHIQRDDSMHSTPTAAPRVNTNLDSLHREAFTRLRESVAESGEGFVRRMREWEQRRHMESCKSSMLGNDKDREKRKDRGRGRKGRTARSLNSHSEGRRISSHLYSQGGDERLDACAPLCGQEVTDDEDDILLDGSTQMTFDVDVEQRQRKRRTASLRDSMDVADSPDVFDVEIAHSDEELYPTRFTTALTLPFMYSNIRSSSPFSFINTSDDESSYAHTHSGFSSPRGMHRSVDYSRNTCPPQNHPGFRGMHLPEGADYDSPEVSPLSTSPTSSNPSFTLSSRALSIPQIIPASTPESLLESLLTPNPRSPQTASDKAVAALALALANGTGSLADYGSLREAQGDLEEHEAGALWD